MTKISYVKEVRKEVLCIDKDGVIYEEMYSIYDYKQPWKYFKVGNYMRQRHQSKRLRKIATKFVPIFRIVNIND